MNELIKITTNEKGVQCVSARELHEFLEIGKVFGAWINDMMRYGFEENVDYTTYWSDSKNGNAVEYLGSPQKMSAKGYTKEYIITIDMAKEISMIQRTEKGKQARLYFIECEKKLKSQVPQLTKKQQLQLSILNGDDLEKISSLAQYETLIIGEATKPLLDKIEEDKPKVDYYEQMLTTIGCRTVTDIAKDYGLNVQKLNKILHEQDVQYKSKSGQWLLYKEHDGKGYVQTSTYITKNNEAKYTTKWTAKGQKFIYDLLKELGINPNQ